MWEHDRCVNHFRVDQLQNFEIRFKGVANQDRLGGELAKQHGLHVAQFCCNSAKNMRIFYVFKSGCKTQKHEYNYYFIRYNKSAGS